ncbi:MAG: tRNA pseudouridine55 synthase [Solirubrobacteraceae bacterium]|nr:tRNA pseudouridine55 synthase [Solirubrobacteraceae bacterium]
MTPPARKDSPALLGDRPPAVQDGVLLVDKPAGKTSHDIVAAVRREHRGRRVGHAGTLDPFATGLLLVLVGRATRIQRQLMALTKRYETTARLGATSSTGDPEGEITVTGRIPPLPPDLPTGELLQRPHAYSAVKVGGRRAYELARAGEDVVLAERPVTVHRFEQLWREDDRAAFAIECSAGTYVRTLIGDLGDAYCESLRRTGIGPFDVADADPGRLLSLEQALCFLPVVRLQADDARRAGHGVAVDVSCPQGAAEVLLVDADGPIAIAAQQDGGLKPVVGFRG